MLGRCFQPKGGQGGLTGGLRGEVDLHQVTSQETQILFTVHIRFNNKALGGESSTNNLHLVRADGSDWSRTEPGSFRPFQPEFVQSSWL